nr:M20 family metallopeptidase [Candidatus Korarchaeota archaeon]NIU82093.1 ArgE/DapE family deacylase [Candidatus Thorarchaeota archaeon]NIW12504.1 ArgE/DapE family deacylase [Candidatus Thorarchaeota archaeon]NIW50723.1 ArgE/DapE family deacylase [Candidatus Korarchaeota archaeon]
INLIAHIGNNSEPTLSFNGHMDVVPAGNLKKWDHPPYGGVIKNGYLWGRGASDMKGGVAGLLSAMRILTQVEDNLNGKLSLTLVPDEETGGHRGSGYIVREKLVKPDACIIAEPTGIPLIDIGQKGAIWLKIIVEGVPTHGSLAPYKGDNAILKAQKVMNNLLRLTEMPASPGKDIASVIEQSKPLIEDLIGEKGIGKVLSFPTVNIGTIKGGTKTNIVPSECEFDVDIRLPIGITVEEAKNKIKNLLEEFGANIKIKFETTIDPNYTLPNTDLVTSAKKTVNEIVDEPAQLFVQWASSDARFFRLNGIPTIHYGPAEVEGIHGYNEKVKVDDLVTATKVYVGTALDYLQE